eukprot:762424-Hanusia_phi.AAC.4
MTQQHQRSLEAEDQQEGQVAEFARNDQLSVPDDDVSTQRSRRSAMEEESMRAFASLQER